MIYKKKCGELQWSDTDSTFVKVVIGNYKNVNILS